ncbi:hypothetical protein MCHI_003289 [Candidatus Magnetoovum chiemensis]|nr:hypothetical protein MCHI_003289 [Candidatus Magnetoovum chiemensis]
MQIQSGSPSPLKSAQLVTAPLAQVALTMLRLLLAPLMFWTVFGPDCQLKILGGRQVVPSAPHSVSE